MSHEPAIIEPFYFGNDDRRLFGCYHVPPSASRKDCGVVMCYPVGDEYIRFHRVFRLLGDRLAKAGFPVLRFDYYGCGDSMGDGEQGRLNAWLEDLGRAVDHMGNRFQITRRCLIGLRLGGTLAVWTGAARGDIDGLALWDPVIHGADYQDELTALHRRMLGQAHVQAAPGPSQRQTDERLGFPLTDSLRADIDGVDLLTVRRKPADKALVIHSNDKASSSELCDHLKALRVEVAHEHHPHPEIWVWEEAIGKIRVPFRVIQGIVAWISEVYS